jgi:hypothetical protein
MNDSSILDAIADELQCGICLDLLEDPRPTCEWGHTFCKKVSESVNDLVVGILCL